MGWVAVATTKELGRRRKLRVEVDGTAIALFQAEGKVYAFADLCVHQDRSLFKGTLLHGKVICPGHQWQFELETGYEADQDLCQPTYPVRVDDDGTVYISAAVSENAVSENAVSENAVSENAASENAASENAAAQEASA